jgi:adenylyltransferase/sulfurtransferase
MFLLDVREPHEFALCHLPGSTLIPLSSLPNRLGEISREWPVVVYCHRGGRSAAAIRLLQKEDFPELLNLEGGIDAWAQEVDEDMSRY